MENPILRIERIVERARMKVWRPFTTATEWPQTLIERGVPEADAAWLVNLADAFHGELKYNPSLRVLERDVIEAIEEWTRRPGEPARSEISRRIREVILRICRDLDLESRGRAADGSSLLSHLVRLMHALETNLRATADDQGVLLGQRVNHFASSLNQSAGEQVRLVTNLVRTVEELRQAFASIRGGLADDSERTADRSVQALTAIFDFVLQLRLAAEVQDMSVSERVLGILPIEKTRSPDEPDELALVLERLLEELDDCGVSVIHVERRTPVDGRFHRVISTVDPPIGEEYLAGTVAEVALVGFLKSDRILRQPSVIAYRKRARGQK